MHRFGARCALAALGLAALAACSSVPVTEAPDPVPNAAPDAVAPTVAAPSRDAQSLELERYYARVQRDLLSQGLLRTDGGGVDTPFNARMLEENFIRIAMFDEYVARGGILVSEQTPSRIRRWESPVRMQVYFGDRVDAAQRQRDTASVEAHARRLARATRHPISTVESDANYHILVLYEDERRGYGDALRALIPGIGETAVQTVLRMPRSTFCLVFAFSRGDSSVYTQAVAVVRAEHPDLMRLSCLHEEMAQGLGLANDSPQARPSIFNDDEEFALLTDMDELMLQMLYDRRLRPGMGLAEAQPIVRDMARELRGGS